MVFLFPQTLPRRNKVDFPARISTSKTRTQVRPSNDLMIENDFFSAPHRTETYTRKYPRSNGHCNPHLIPLNRLKSQSETRPGHTGPDREPSADSEVYSAWSVPTYNNNMTSSRTQEKSELLYFFFFLTIPKNHRNKLRWINVAACTPSDCPIIFHDNLVSSLIYHYLSVYGHSSTHVSISRLQLPLIVHNDSH